MTQQSDPRPVRVTLAGDDHDLGVLAHHFATGDPRVELTSGGGAVLISQALDAHWQDHPRLHTEAESLVELLNGIGLLVDHSYEPVRALPRYEGADGIVRVFATDSMRLRAFATVTATVGAGPAQPTHPAGASILAKAGHSPDLAAVLALVSERPLGTDRMWKIYEIIRANVGGPAAKVSTPKLHGTGWLAPDEFASLREAINNPHVTGEAARHAVHDAPKAAQISIEQARSLLLRLIEQWRRTL